MHWVSGSYCISVAEPVVKHSLGLQISVAEGTNSDSKSSKARLKETETRSGAVTYTFHKNPNFWVSLPNKKILIFYQQKALKQLYIQIYVIIQTERKCHECKLKGKSGEKKSVMSKNHMTSNELSHFWSRGTYEGINMTSWSYEQYSDFPVHKWSWTVQRHSIWVRQTGGAVYTFGITLTSFASVSLFHFVPIITCLEKKKRNIY